MNRRTLLKMSAAAALLPRISLPADSAQRANLPAEVAGIRLPQSDLALAAATFARQSCPDFLFNHCMRSFTFGALLLQRQAGSFNVDTAFDQRTGALNAGLAVERVVNRVAVLTIELVHGR